MTKRPNHTTAWIRKTTRDRMKSCLPNENWTYNDLINEALNQADFDPEND
jgi:hypothetical protein